MCITVHVYTSMETAWNTDVIYFAMEQCHDVMGQRHHCDVTYIAVLYFACWNIILYDIYMKGTHF